MFWSKASIRFLLSATLLFAATLSVNAWTETPPAAQPGSQPSAQIEGVPGVSVEPGSSGAALNDGQTEINIPGVGSIGVLPKLDFGLDLLYGANSEETAESAPKNDDVIIRGTLKHRF
ncbi:MAG: hypothetical protein H7X92_05740 [Chitinophagales bacterium]|nr:hypothetical protein [Hyphomicrobiales bacterium]